MLISNRSAPRRSRAWRVDAPFGSNSMLTSRRGADLTRRGARPQHLHAPMCPGCHESHDSHDSHECPECHGSGHRGRSLARWGRGLVRGGVVHGCTIREKQHADASPRSGFTIAGQYDRMAAIRPRGGSASAGPHDLSPTSGRPMPIAACSADLQFAGI